jgi:hypothetical protein
MPNIINARIDKIFTCSILLLSMVVSACTVQPSEKTLASPVQPQAKTGDNMTATNPLEIATQKTLADASRRTGVDVSALKVVSAERVTWSDGSMGCPAPGMAYTQALIDGYRIRIQASKALLHYHGGAEPRFCPADRVKDALPNDKI